MIELKRDLDRLDRRLLSALRREGPSSKGALARSLHIRPNTAGERVQSLLAGGWLVEQTGVGAGVEGAGRPAVPVGLRVHERGPWLAGLSLGPGGVESAAVGLDGRARPGARANVRRLGKGGQTGVSEALAEALRALVEGHGPAGLAGVGLAVTGFVDPARRVLLFSSSRSVVAPTKEVSLEPVWSALADAGLAGVEVTVDNDMHALAARWRMSVGMADDTGAAHEDVLLVRVGDGQLGAAVLIAGQPNRGALVGANELGHMRMGVVTTRCYCGGIGCLERIVSTVHVRAQAGGVGVRTLVELAAGYDPSQRDQEATAVGHVLHVLATGLANAINLLRPHRVVLISEFTRFEPFRTALLRGTRAQTLPGLDEAVMLEMWDEPVGTAAETASYLALAALLNPPVV